MKPKNKFPAAALLLSLVLSLNSCHQSMNEVTTLDGTKLKVGMSRSQRLGLSSNLIQTPESKSVEKKQAYFTREDSAQHVKIRLESKDFPPRALDPILKIGDQEFKDFQYENGKLLFVIPKNKMPTQDLALYMLYGNQSPILILIRQE